MLRWHIIIQSVLVPLIVVLVAATLFLLLWLARDRPGAFKGHPKQFFNGTKHSLTKAKKTTIAILFQAAFMATFFLFGVDFDRQSMPSFAITLLYIAWFLIILSCIIGLSLAFFVKNDLLFLFVTFGIISIVTAGFLGTMIYETDVAAVRIAAEGHHFTGINPVNDAKLFKGAGTIEFSPQAFVDDTRSRGFLSGTIYCAAPIDITTAPIRAVQFWAVGKNCCHSRGGFKCGAYKKPLSGSLFGSVVPPPVAKTTNWPWMTEYELYYQAVSLASADYTSNPEPILVRLEDAPDDSLTQYTLTCGGKNLAMIHAGEKGSQIAQLTMTTENFERFIPVKGEGNWYNIMINYSSHVWYLSAHNNGHLYFLSHDSGTGHQRWFINKDGTIESLTPTNAGSYLGCDAKMTTVGGAWKFPDWNFGDSTKVGWGGLAIFFFGSGTAILWYTIFSVVYFLLLLWILSLISPPRKEDQKKPGEP